MNIIRTINIDVMTFSYRYEQIEENFFSIFGLFFTKSHLGEFTFAPLSPL